MALSKVYLENRNDCNPQEDAYHRLFSSRGYETVKNAHNADLIVFTGGEDVNPSLYGSNKHPTAIIQRRRDVLCKGVWNYAKATETPCVGICRGAQFLHVMNGGYLVQDTDKHDTPNGHSAKVLWMPNTEILVSSTHHQMMGDTDLGELLMYSSESTRKELMTCITDDAEIMYSDSDIDPEAMYYPSTNSLSYQPHPEYSVEHEEFKECADAFFFLINNYLEN